MRLIIVIYIINAMLLVLHEIESAYEKEWEILRLPGRITGFLLLHIPILFIMFYGLIELERMSRVGSILGIVLGAGGLLPLLIHKFLASRKDRFALFISNAIIYLNVVTGVVLIYLAISELT
jgi:hypothetical protein